MEYKEQEKQSERIVKVESDKSKEDIDALASKTLNALHYIITNPDQIIDPFLEIGLTLSEYTNFLYRAVSIMKENLQNHSDDIQYIAEIYKLIKVDTLSKLYIYGIIGGHFDTQTESQIIENIEQHDSIMSAVYKGFEMKTFISWKTKFTQDFIDEFSPKNILYRTPDHIKVVEDAFKEEKIVYLEEIGSLNDDFSTLMSLLQLGMTGITLKKKYVLLQIFDISYYNQEGEYVSQSNKSRRLMDLFDMVAPFGQVKKPVKKDIEGTKITINKSYYLLPIKNNLFKLAHILVDYIYKKQKAS